MSTQYFDPAFLRDLPDQQAVISKVATTIQQLRQQPGIPAPGFAAVADYSVPAYYSDPTGFVKAVAPLTRDAALCYLDALYGNWVADTSYRHEAATIIANWGSVNKQVSGHDGPLSMAELGVSFCIADSLGIKTTALPIWLPNVYLPTCDGIKSTPGNWGDWGTFGAIAGRQCLGHDTTVDQAVLSSHIVNDIAPDGSMPIELARGEGAIWYTYFALAPMCAACRLIQQAGGPNLFPGSVERALNYLLNLVQHPPAGMQPPTTTDPWPADLFSAMGIIAPTIDWTAWLAYGQTKWPVVYVSHHIAWPTPQIGL